MKTLTILVAGLTVAWSASARACDPTTRALADQAHARAVELAAATLPYAQYDRHWAGIARRSAQADAAAEAVIAALACGNYCAARDAADRLHDLAKDIQDDAEDLEFCRNPWGGPCRDTARSIECLADQFEDVTSDLRRAVRRLDESTYPGRPPGRPFCGTPVPTTPAVPYAVPQPPDTLPQTAPGATGGYLGQPSPAPQGGSFPPAGSTLGPTLTTPPADLFGPSPAAPSGSYTPQPTGVFYRGFGPSADATYPRPSTKPYHSQSRHVDRPAGPVLLLR